MDRVLETVEVFGSLLSTMLVLFVPITIGIVLIQRWVGPERLQRWLGGRSLPVALVKGTALGAITPFCGCSTIPLLVGLLRANVRFAGVAAFMLASPLLSPYILGVVTLLFGWRVTVAYTAVAVGSTLVIATLWELTGFHRHLKLAGYEPPPSRRSGTPTADGSEAGPVASGLPVAAAVASTPVGIPAASGPGAPFPTVEAQDPGACSTVSDEDPGCSASPDATPAAWRGLRAEIPDAWGEAHALLRPMLVPMLVGLAIGAVLYGAVPDGALADLLGASTWFTLPLAALLGLPLYLRGEAAFPIGAGLLAAGVGEGPMFAMVIAGMGASLPEVTILSGIFRPKLLAAFLASVFAMAIVGGAVIPAVV